MVVAGVNFRKATLDIRNKFALTTEHIKKLYAGEGTEVPDDFFILSTCNRTEIYSSSADAVSLLNFLAQNSHVTQQDVTDYAFVKTGNDAVKHLFRVASGLESQILGDYEIVGQLKNTFVLAKSFGKASGYMERLVNSALQASRHIKNNTHLSDGTTSVSYAVIQILKQVLNQQQPKRICLLGLGKIGTLTLKNLKHYMPQHKVTLVNRNEAKAESAAGEYSVDYAPYANQAEVLSNADVLIVATGADHAIISKTDIAATGVKLIFDLSVPSNVDANVSKLEGVQLYDIDGLSKIVNEVIDARRFEIPRAEMIVEHFLDEFKQWEVRRIQYKSSDKSEIQQGTQA